MSVDKKRVGDVSGNNREIINIDIIHIVYQVDPLPLRSIGRFDNPDVLFRIMLPEFLVMRVELSKLIRQDIGIRCEIKIMLPVLLLQPDNITTKPILSRYLMTLRKMIDLLVLIKPFIDIRLATRSTPKQIPLMTLSMTEPISLTNRSNHPIISSKHLEKQLAVLYMVRTLAVVHARWAAFQQLRFFEHFEL